MLAYLWVQRYAGTEILKHKINLELKFMKKPEDQNYKLHFTGRGFRVYDSSEMLPRCTACC